MRQMLVFTSSFSSLNPRLFAKLGYFTKKDGFAETTMKFKEKSCSFC